MGVMVVFLLMPALACASINFYIEVSPKKDQTSAKFNGTCNNGISYLETNSFNLTDSNLKEAVKAYQGGSPQGVYLNSLTPWGDLYKTYNWSEVERETIVKTIKIVAFNTEKVTLANRQSVNNLTSTDTVYTANMDAIVSNFLRKSSKGEKISAVADYNVDLAMGLNPPLHMKLVSHLDIEYELVRWDKKIQAETDVVFTLKPSQSANCVLNATKVEIEILVEYESNLRGSVVTNYNPRFKGHHFWAYDVRDVAKASHATSSSLKRTDQVTVQYFTDAFVHVTDANTGSKVVSIPADYVL